MEAENLTAPCYCICCKIHTLRLNLIFLFSLKPLANVFNVILHGSCVNPRLKDTINPWSLPGVERQKELLDASKSVFAAKLTCHRRGHLEQKPCWVFLQFNHLTSFIFLQHLFHLAPSVPSSLCQSQYSKQNKTAYHDDKGDRSYKAPYEMIIHT